MFHTDVTTYIILFSITLHTDVTYKTCFHDAAAVPLLNPAMTLIASAVQILFKSYCVIHSLDLINIMPGAGSN